jgi:hypothetical protein
MATKGPHPEGEPWVPLIDVLAEVAGMDPSRVFADEAEAQAKRMRGVRRDWCGRPCITWTTAAELLASLKAERARVLAAHEERLIAAAEAHLAAVPRGIPVSAEVPGLSAAMLMMVADPLDQSQRRESPLQHALANGGAPVYHPLPQGEAS